MSKSKLKTKLNSVEDTSHFFDGNSVVNNSYEENKIFQNVNHPDHYQSSSGLEVIDVIEDFNLGFCLGNVIKYVLRCGKKDAEIQELEKAKWYLEREINNRINNKNAIS